MAWRFGFSLKTISGTLAASKNVALFESGQK